MSLPSGHRIGPYEIVSPLGAGGMGEVYRAKDSKLKREVALKVLPADVANDRERLARFQREAEVLASLNHPHIAHVYGIEQNALVMELVEGEDLSERIRRGPIPIDEALPIAKQIAEALEAAHEQGIIHRDLKPANVKVRPDGTVKVLDFGLAKAMDATTTAPDLLNSPTITSPAMTMRGVILGTAAYMAPEQAKGKAVDKRADIWAFGCVLYEMITGRAPFGGETITDVIAAVVRSEPDWRALDAGTPPRVRRLLERCLTKDPKSRLRDIGDARVLFEEDDRVPAIAAPMAPVARSATKEILPWAIAAAALIAAAVIARPAWRPAPAAALLRFVEPVSSSMTGPNPVLAPDGSFLVYRTDRLHLRRLSELETLEIPGTIGGSGPFVSPDSRWVGFYADGKMKKAAVGGREPIAITDGVGDAAGAAFVTNDRIVFSPTWYKSALHSVSADGGPVTRASTLDEAAGERGHWYPHVLPGSRHVLFTIWYAAAGLSASKIGVLDLDTGTHRVLFPGAMARFAAGHVLYYHGGQYHLAPFDPSTHTMTGEPKPVLPDALTLDPTGDSNIPWSLAPTGALAYWPGVRYPLMTFTWIDRNGQFAATPIRSEVEGAAVSPDDRQVAVGRPQGGLAKVWIFDLAGGEQPIGEGWWPSWHPDGRRVAYTTMSTGQYDVGTQALDGPRQIALSAEIDEAAVGWLADNRIVVREWLAASSTSVAVVDPVSKQRMPLVTGDFEKFDPRVSPDGRWLALCANPTGTSAVYVRAVAERGSLQRMAGTADGSCDVRWSAGTKELAFLRGNTLVALAYEEREGRLVPLRETVVALLPQGTDLYGVSRDGNRFLLGIPPPNPIPVTGIRVILDGIAALSGAAR